jgi:hypothetical protein
MLLLGAVVGDWGGVVLIVTSAALIVFGVLNWYRAWQSRASDVLLEAEGLRFDGGKLHKLFIPWSEIDGSETKCEALTEPRFTLGGLIFSVVMKWIAPEDPFDIREPSPIRQLRLGTLDGQIRTLAKVAHPEEQASLDALFATISARVKGAPDSTPEASADVLRCTSCHAVLLPADLDEIVCSFCRTPNKVPSKLRKRLQASKSTSENKEVSAKALGALLEQPGAGRVSFVLIVSSLLSIVPWVFSVFILYSLGFENVGRFEVGWEFVGGGLMTLTLFLFARTALMKRRALHLIALDFGARTHESGYCCRSCGGPLVVVHDALLCRCVFCDSDNVLGLNIVGRKQATSKERHSLEDALKVRKRERRRWLWLAFLALIGGSFAALMSTVSFVVAAEFAELQEKCDQDDPVACYELGVDIYLGISVGQDEPQGMVLYAKACKLDHAEACFELGQHYYYGWALDEDREESEFMRTKACRLGWEKACEPYEELGH